MLAGYVVFCVKVYVNCKLVVIFVPKKSRMSGWGPLSVEQAAVSVLKEVEVRVVGRLAEGVTEAGDVVWAEMEAARSARVMGTLILEVL